ncbi:SDR family oxidoreductase [Pseudidiomarina sp. GXY010]|uniref:SDR family oxidoreductase n=1 Tax=Pseudidiomarina fusca TaxID=2965078 RepID=A0ABU3KT33_9GAMM|nr:SDR family oxidoreductase [Pseudidiomarina sp. GXY010]MDT7524650.1 SDR family oxidoreductase [Pseudidiomarina sp. GXY010]
MPANSPPQTPVALITGAGRRFGFTLAKALLAEGYQVFAHYHTSRDGIAELEQLGAVGLAANLADLNQVLALAEQLKQHTQRLDLLVNNASCFFNNATVDDQLDHLTAVLNVHTAAPYLLIRELAPLLRQSQNQQAMVLNITDIYVDSPATDYIAYCAAKAGLASLTQAFAKHLAPHIRVNAIQPGPILFLPEHDSEHRRKVLAQTPLKVEGGLEPMLAAVRFLRDNPYVTGESIKVDGGRALNI